nr:hypothetical protein [Tanacetum cinerariifolium]
FIPQRVLVDEDEDSEEKEFQEEEEPKEEEKDTKVDIKEDKNEQELTYPYEEVDSLNPPPPASDSEPKDVIEIEDTVKSEDVTVPVSVHKIIMENVISPDHVDDLPVVEPNQPDVVPFIPQRVLVDEDEDSEEKEFQEEEEPKEEEKDTKVDIKEDKNEQELTYPYEEELSNCEDGLRKLRVFLESVNEQKARRVLPSRINSKNGTRIEEPKGHGESVKVDAYIRALSKNIKGEVTSSRPTNLNEAMYMANKLMEQKSQARNERILEGNNATSVERLGTKRGIARNRVLPRVLTLSLFGLVMIVVSKVIRGTDVERRSSKRKLEKFR